MIHVSVVKKASKKHHAAVALIAATALKCARAVIVVPNQIAVNCYNSNNKLKAITICLSPFLLVIHSSVLFVTA